MRRTGGRNIERWCRLTNPYPPILSAEQKKRLARLVALCRSLPAVSVETYGGSHRKFSVRKKTFAYYLNNHHGDGIIAVCCKSTTRRQQELVTREPNRYLVPAYLGPSGWVSLRLDGARVDWGEVLPLMVAAYRLQAPKELASELE